MVNETDNMVPLSFAALSEAGSVIIFTATEMPVPFGKIVDCQFVGEPIPEAVKEITDTASKFTVKLPGGKKLF